MSRYRERARRLGKPVRLRTIVSSTLPGTDSWDIRLEGLVQKREETKMLSCSRQCGVVLHVREDDRCMAKRMCARRLGATWQVIIPTGPGVRIHATLQAASTNSVYKTTRVHIYLGFRHETQHNILEESQRQIV